MGSLRRKLESSETWKGIVSTVSIAAVKHHLLQMYTGTPYWILLTSQRLNEITPILASHTLSLNKNQRLMLTCSSYGFDPVSTSGFTSLTLPKTSTAWIFIFPLLFSSSYSKHYRAGLVFNKTFFRYWVSLQLQQEQYPGVLSFPFGSNSLWVSNGLCFGEIKKDNNERFKIALLRKIWVWF